MRKRLGIYGVAVLLLLTATMAAKPGWPWSVKADFWAEPAVIERGQSSTLYWVCSRSSRSADLDGEDVPLVGDRMVSPTESTNYRLNVQGRRLTWSSMIAVTVTEPTPPVPPVPPTPPPQPTAGMHVLMVGPSPRVVRDLTPDQAAILTSRTLRDWLDVACPKLADGATAYRCLARDMDAALLSEEWNRLLTKAPVDDKCYLVAKILPDGKELVAPLPASTGEVIQTLSDLIGRQLAPQKSVIPKPRMFTAAEWEQFKSKTGVVVVNGEKRYLSAKPRDRQRYPYGKAPGATSLAEAGVRVIPRSEWPARIAALKAANAGIMPLTYGKVPCSDQGGTNYCWAHSAKNPVEAVSYIQGRPLRQLSACSVGGPITGYRNKGGWPADAIRFIQKTGAVGVNLWPENSINSSYASRPEVKADYPRNRIVTQIADLGGTGDIWEESITCVLLGAPVAVSYDWWGHAVEMVGADMDGSRVVGVFRNSWGDSFGDSGFFSMPEGGQSNHGTPDDAQAILMVLAL